MAGQLRLRVVTPSRQVLEAQVDEVRLPGVLGEIGVLPGHTPLLTSLATGPLTYFARGRGERLVIQGGFAEVQPEAVTVLARLAESAEEVDLESARDDARAAEAALKSATADELEEVATRLRLAQTRIEVAAAGR